MFGFKSRSASPPKLSSTESLDVMMTITSPTGWLLLAACAAIILAVIVWSIVHRIPERVDGQGLLVPGDTQAVEAPVTGVITRIFVRPGQAVKEGDKILALTVPNAIGELEILRQDLANIERDNAAEATQETEAQAKKRQAHEVQKATYEEQRQSARASRDFEVEHLKRLKVAGYDVGTLQRTEGQIKAAETQLSTLAQNLETLEKSYLDEQFGANSQKRANEERARVQRERIFQKELQVERVIGAKEDGRVFNVMVDEGNTVSANQVLVRLEQPNRDLLAIIYVPSRPGQKVKVGHVAEVSPSNVSGDAYGSIAGKVDKKDDYPSTRAGIMKDLQNETLTDEYIKGGAPLRMKVKLDTNSDDPSGYSWTGGTGPSMKLIAGTPCRVTLIVDQKRPIDYVIPLFKKH